MQRKFGVLACIVLCANCFAQQYPFVYYTPRDGLVNSRVRSIKQDSWGRMYAEQLFISTNMVRQHIHKIYEKLHVQNRTEAINKAFGKN